jgi:aerobic carbon-monoxide dehydrogenase medium subunit
LSLQGKSVGIHECLLWLKIRQKQVTVPQFGLGHSLLISSRLRASPYKVRGRHIRNHGLIQTQIPCQPRFPTPAAREEKERMYPSRFDYDAPASIEEAISILDQNGGEAKVLAGGQSLIPMLKLRFASPERVVDINGIPGLEYHRIDPDGTLRIGALCRHEDLEFSTILGDTFPTLASAASLVSDPIIRTRGTFVGSLCHADPQGDWSATMIALGGRIVAQGPNGRREIEARDFVLGPFVSALAFNEIAVEAIVPPAKGKPLGGYLKLERRVGDFATASVAVALDMDGDTVTHAGCAMAGVGGRTIDANEAISVLNGKTLTTENIKIAAEAVAAVAEPRTDHRGSADYKRHITETFVVRILSNIAHSEKKAA